MPKRVALIHTVTSLPATFKSLCAELIPDADRFTLSMRAFCKTPSARGN